jgi:hypothetical protein
LQQGGLHCNKEGYIATRRVTLRQGRFCCNKEPSIAVDNVALPQRRRSQVGRGTIRRCPESQGEPSGQRHLTVILMLRSFGLPGDLSPPSQRIGAGDTTGRVRPLPITVQASIPFGTPKLDLPLFCRYAGLRESYFGAEQEAL